MRRSSHPAAQASAPEQGPSRLHVVEAASRSEHGGPSGLGLLCPGIDGQKFGSNVRRKKDYAILCIVVLVVDYSSSGYISVYIVTYCIHCCKLSLIRYSLPFYILSC